MIAILFWMSLNFAHAETVVALQIKDHKMTPESLVVKAGEKFVIEVSNLDNTSEELESNSLKFERIIGPKKTVRVRMKSLKEGTYDIYGDFHADLCRGTIVATSEPTKP